MVVYPPFSVTADDRRSGTFAEAATIPKLTYLRSYPGPSATACSVGAVKPGEREAVVATALFSLPRKATTFSGIRNAI